MHSFRTKAHFFRVEGEKKTEIKIAGKFLMFSKTHCDAVAFFFLQHLKSSILNGTKKVYPNIIKAS